MIIFLTALRNHSPGWEIILLLQRMTESHGSLTFLALCIHKVSLFYFFIDDQNKTYNPREYVCH